MKTETLIGRKQAWFPECERIFFVFFFLFFLKKEIFIWLPSGFAELWKYSPPTQLFFFLVLRRQGEKKKKDYISR